MNAAITSLFDMVKKQHGITPKIKYKDKSAFMKFLGFIVKLWCPDFMTNYTTVIGNTIYLPNEDYLKMDENSIIRILAHEIVHMYDKKRLNIWYSIAYLLPQLLAIFSLLTFLAFINLYWLYALFFLVFLLPIPSPGRKYIEMRGYAMTLRCAMLQYKYTLVIDTYANQIAYKFCASSYYFMWPFREKVKEELKKQAASLSINCDLFSDFIRWHNNYYS